MLACWLLARAAQRYSGTCAALFTYPVIHHQPHSLFPSNDNGLDLKVWPLNMASLMFLLVNWQLMTYFPCAARVKRLPVGL